MKLSVMARYISGINGLATIGRAALDLLLPAQCATCDVVVDRPGQFCAACFAATGFVSEPACARCGVPFGAAGHGGPERLCPGCRARPPAFARARAALRYDAQARKIILPFKHGDRIEFERRPDPKWSGYASWLKEAPLG